MHSYYRAIGFSGIRSITQLNKLIGKTVRRCDAKRIFETDDGRSMAEFSRDYGEGAGLTVVGEYDEKERFYAEYVMPYLIGTKASSEEDVYFEKHASSDSWTGACDDLRVGTTLIFSLQNLGEYMQSPARKRAMTRGRKTALAGLCLAGTILLPVEKPDDAPHGSDPRHEELMRAAMNGDEAAIESLTIEDFDTYSMLMERMNKEDVLSIVDNYFMPNGSDCECYSILGSVEAVGQHVNTETGEPFWKLSVSCNDILMDVAVHTEDLIGEPRAGRRFKGNIWLTGTVLF